MSARDTVLKNIRTALGRTEGQKPTTVPEPLLRVRNWSIEEKLALFRGALEKLAGRVFVANSQAEARDYVAAVIEGKTAIASGGALLEECGILELPGVQRMPEDTQELRNACATCDVGITSAWCLLAETGTVVMRTTTEEPRMISLLPPVHVAVVSRSKMLANLDELLGLLPRPVEDMSSLVLITGPSRTGDIEQFLVRGVHGPGVIHVVLI